MSKLTEKDDQGNWMLKEVPWKMLRHGAKGYKKLKLSRMERCGTDESITNII